MRFLFIPLAALYAVITILRNFCYDYGFFKTLKASIPVISVGNITAGGSGKTPLTIFLAKEAKLHGFKPGILSRGYGRNSKGLQIVHDGNEMKNTVENSGDEPFLMASLLKDVPVVVSENRVNGADKLNQDYGVNLIILDDGFQHRKIYRDIDIVLINASEKSNAYYMIPFGQLREMVWGLRRANYIVVTKGDMDGIPYSIQKFIRRPIKSIQKYKAKQYIASNQYKNIEECKDESCGCVSSPVFAFCGIANGDLFLETLNEMKIDIFDSILFKDHVEYDEYTVDSLKSKINSLNIKTVITTEKDIVKLPESFFKEFEVYVLTMKMELPSEFIDEIFNGFENLV